MRGEQLEFAGADGHPDEWQQIVIKPVPKRTQERGYVPASEMDGVPAAHNIPRDLTDWRTAQDRARTFHHAVSNGLWCIYLSEPVSLDMAKGDQIRQIRRVGHISDCNEIMAGMLRGRSADEIIGSPLDHHPLLCGVVGKLVRSRYDLPRTESCVLDDGRSRHFLMRALGTPVDGKIRRIWGGCLEITDQVELEHRMVSAMENKLSHIGREIHDGLGQVLTAAGIFSQCLESDLTQENGKAPERARRLVQLTEKAQQMVHSIYGQLASPSIARGQSIFEALEDLCSDTDAQADHLRCVFLGEPEVDPPDSDVNHHLYCIVQEAIDNAVSHAHADCVVVSMWRTDQDEIVVEISDDGGGFDEHAIGKESLGLTSLYYRARKIGAQLQIESSPGEGTTVRCCLPACLAYHDEGIASSRQGE